MPELNIFSIFTSRLNQAEIPYMVTGSVACIIYGQPRMTHDVDMVVRLEYNRLTEFIVQFPSDQFYCPPEEVIRLENARESRGHFNVIHHETGFKADIYPVGNEFLHQWGMANRKKVSLRGDILWLAPPEYVIIRKLQYYQEGKSSKHLTDVRNMLEISSGLIDHDILRKFIGEYNLQNEWTEANKTH
ncbi:MAG: hypothetical protein KAJ46_07910 [Sedimentisphaerales bacterium]|nr:hypothetical protein [Sedimentisphaerales bacterium]